MKKYPLLLYQRSADVNIRFKSNYLAKMRGYPIPMIYFSRMVLIWHLSLVGTVLNCR